MADRYWVSGSGNWDATSTANWSATSGGSAGASAPTSADNVIFDANSNVGTGTFTVTVTGTSAAPAVCNDFSTGGAGGALDGAMTLTMGATAFLDCYGSMTLPATNFSISGAAGANIRYRATTTGKTITTNGVSFGSVAVVFNGSGGGWTLGSAFTSSQFFTIDTGSVNTGNFNVTADRLLAGGTNTRTITLGSSTLTFVSGSPVTLNATGLTFDAGTSTIICSLAASPTFAGGGLTFYNVSFTSTSAGTATITGANTYNNLTFTSLAATGLRNISVGANQTVNGTLTLGTANTAIRRMFMYSDVVGTNRTITTNAIATIADVDFRNITAAGTAGTWSGTRLGNCLGNSNITFDAGKTVYWNLAGAQVFSATGWATTNTGTPNANNFPLAQDTAVFTEAGSLTGQISIDAAWNLGTLTYADGVSNRISAATINYALASPTFYGNVTYFANLTLNGNFGIIFAGQGLAQTYTTAGVVSAGAFTQPITLNSFNGTLVLGDALTLKSSFTLTQGTLDLNDFNASITTFSSTGSLIRQIDFGTATLNVSGATFTASGSNFTTAGTGSVSMNSASSKTFAGGGFSYKGLNQGGAGELIITGANTFTNITNTNATASTITFPNATTTVSDFTVSGSSGNLVTLRRTGASGTFTLNYTGASATFVDYVSISNSTATPSSKFYAGVNSTDGGGNTGWTFNYTPTTMYWVNGSGTWSATSKTNWAAFLGSAGGNVVPTSSTNVIFDTNSDSGSAFTVTIDNGVCNNLDASAINQTMTIDYNSKVLSVYGTTFTGASTGLIAKTGTGYIDMISASNKTFAGGGNIYGKIRNAGAGDLTITGANTFDDIANSTQPCTIKLPSGVVTKVVDFNLNGTFGNYVTLKSTTDGVQATLEYI